MNRERHPIWDTIEGKAPYPPCDQLIGCENIEAVPGSGEIKLSFEAKKEFLNPAGTIQGGFLAAMLDATIGQALATAMDPGIVTPTLELKVNFMSPAYPGKLFGHGNVVQLGKSIAFVEGKLSDENEKLIATATATLKMISLNKKAS